jgi:CheY-like chemotaxis protein
LVDDDARVLENLRQVLDHNGLGCVTAPSGTEALVYCDEHRPHVVVTDLSMPGIDGGVLARWLKARYPTVSIVLVTGQQMTEARQLDATGVFSAILPKPVDLDRLVLLLTDLATAARDPVDTSRLP